MVTLNLKDQVVSAVYTVKDGIPNRTRTCSYASFSLRSKSSKALIGEALCRLCGSRGSKVGSNGVGIGTF